MTGLTTTALLVLRTGQLKIDFQDSGHGSHLGFLIRTISTFFDLQVTPMFPTKYKSVGLLVLEKKRKTDFHDGGHGSHFGFQIGMILAILDLQVTPMLPIEFQVNWPFGSGEEQIFKVAADRNSFSYFFSMLP